MAVLSTMPVFEAFKTAAIKLQQWASAGCDGASLIDLNDALADDSPLQAFNIAKSRMQKRRDDWARGLPIKANLDEQGFTGDRVGLYVAAFGSDGQRIHDVSEE